MKIILKKSIKKPNSNSKKSWAVGTVLVTTDEYGQSLIKKGSASVYGGVFPPKPKEKHKIELSQLKTNNESWQ